MIDKEDNGLYILLSNASSRDVNITSSCFISLLRVDSKLDIDLLHRRCGHVSGLVLRKMLSSYLSSITEAVNKYTICPCAKKTRIPFGLASLKVLHVLI